MPGRNPEHTLDPDELLARLRALQKELSQLAARQSDHRLNQREAIDALLRGMLELSELFEPLGAFYKKRR